MALLAGMVVLRRKRVVAIVAVAVGVEVVVRVGLKGGGGRRCIQRNVT